MRISFAKKLSDAMDIKLADAMDIKLADSTDIKPADTSEIVDSRFSWTANRGNTFDRHTEDMIVMINSAARFTATVYGVKLI